MKNLKHEVIRKIESLSPYQLISLNAALCCAITSDQSFSFCVGCVGSPNLAIPKETHEKILEYLSVSQNDYITLLDKTNDEIISAFATFQGLIEVAKDFIIAAKQHDSYKPFLESKFARLTDLLLEEAEISCVLSSREFKSYLQKDKA